MQTVKAMGIALTILMGIFIVLSFYWMSLNGRYTAIYIERETLEVTFPIIIVDTRTGQVALKIMVDVETPVIKPWEKRWQTVVPWAD